jgi:hypothetical protein
VRILSLEKNFNYFENYIIWKFLFQNF